MTIEPLYVEKTVCSSKNWAMLMSWIISVIALLASLFTEYYLKLSPCQLCIYQRIPFLLITIIYPLTFYSKFIPTISTLMKISLVAGVILSSVHLGIQFELIPDMCTVPTNIQTMDDFQSLMNEKPVSCSKISWAFFGIPISGYNLIACCCLFLISYSHHVKSKALKS